MGYGPSPQIGYHHMARMVAKALQRSQPADLPVELATGMRATVRAHIHRLKHAALPPCATRQAAMRKTRRVADADVRRR